MPTGTFHLVSLGCSKNRVDSETMLGRLLQEGWVSTDAPEDADLILVNTCAFIESATQESINTILELAEQKAPGHRLVVTGCLVQRYGNQLERLLPEVDRFFGTGLYDRIDVQGLLSDGPDRTQVGAPGYLAADDAPRQPSWGPHSAYLKISEGCDRRCTFCIIPTLRGRARSRPVSSLVEEAHRLAATGVRELNLVAQDTTAYGEDLGDGSSLARLLAGLSEVPGIAWIRVLYAHPAGIDDALLDAIAHLPHVCRYLDLPLQHASSRMLRRMGRRMDAHTQRRILERIQEQVPGIALRTTFLVGFPGETREDFAQVLDLVSAIRFSRLGAFTWSAEEGTPATRLPDRVPAREARRRLRELINRQAIIAREDQSRLIGRSVMVLVDGPSAETPYLLEGRTETQAPEVDGKVYIANAPEGVEPGTFRVVTITQATEVDLSGEWIEEPQPGGHPTVDESTPPKAH